MDSWWCIYKLTYNCYIFLGEDYYFLKFSVTSCINDTTSNFTWKPNCKTNTEMLT